MKIQVHGDGLTKHVELTDERIEPCPFCGSEEGPTLEHSVIIHYSKPDLWTLSNAPNASYWVGCRCCQAKTATESFPDCLDGNEDKRHLEAARSALAAWNRRTKR